MRFLVVAIVVLLLTTACAGMGEPRPVEVNGQPGVKFSDPRDLRVLLLDRETGEIKAFDRGQWRTPEPQFEQPDPDRSGNDVIVPLDPKIGVVFGRRSGGTLSFIDGINGNPCLIIGDGCGGAFGLRAAQVFTVLFERQGSLWRCPTDQGSGPSFATKEECNRFCESVECESSIF